MRWYKVCEKLPNDDTLVLLCASPKDRPKWYPLIKLALFKRNGSFVHWIDAHNISRYLEKDLNIKLWCKVEYPLELSNIGEDKLDRFEILDL